MGDAHLAIGPAKVEPDPGKSRAQAEAAAVATPTHSSLSTRAKRKNHPGFGPLRQACTPGALTSSRDLLTVTDWRFSGGGGAAPGGV